jgi:hydroxypyruvate isomerase
MQMTEGNLAAGLRRYYPNYDHVQLAGVPGRHEPDAGEINYPYLFSVLDDLGYSGWVGCEYQPLHQTRDGLGWLSAAHKK